MILVLTDAPKLSKSDKIKALRQPLGLSLLAAKDAIDQLEETGYGIVMHVESPRAVESVDADLLTLQ